MEVTEQRAMAVDLRRTTSMFQALVANLPAGVFFVQGPTGHPILVNNRARQLLGRREEPAAGVELLSKVYHLHRPDGSPYPVEELPVFQALRRAPPPCATTSSSTAPTAGACRSSPGRRRFGSAGRARRTPPCGCWRT